jgi:opacity protein-like surface antigen
MKPMICLVFLVCFCWSATAQEQIHQKKSSVISLGYGIGNVWKIFLKNGISPEYRQYYTVTSKGPYALTYEYGFLNKFSCGIQFAYSKVNGKADALTIRDQLTTFSILVRANYHHTKWEWADMYIGGGLGYYDFQYEARDATGSDVYLGDRVPGVIALSAQLGARYYLTEYLGLNAEIGFVAGAIGQVGVAVKF